MEATALDIDKVTEAGKVIRSARGQRTARDVAQRAGVSERRYRDIERGYISLRDGGRKPVQADVDEYTKIASALGIPPTDILDALGIEHTRQEQPPMTNANSVFGTYLYRRRMTALNGTSLRDLAEGSGLSHSTLHIYEAGRSLPTEKSLPLVARAYRVKISELREVLNTALQTRVDIVLPQRFGELSPDAYRALIAHADVLLNLQRQAQHTD